METQSSKNPISKSSKRELQVLIRLRNVTLVTLLVPYCCSMASFSLQLVFGVSCEATCERVISGKIPRCLKERYRTKLMMDANEELLKNVFRRAWVRMGLPALSHIVQRL